MSRLELKVIPDVVALVVAGLMWLVSSVTPPVLIPGAVSYLASIALLSAGCALIVAARAAFARARTTFNPMEPERASDLVTSGVYRVSRNPMYLGTMLVLLAMAALLSNLLSLAVTVLFVVYMDRFQIGPEERTLRARFGPAYDAYAAGVRRWI